MPAEPDAEPPGERPGTEPPGERPGTVPAPARVALVTGASGGIGRALAVGLAQAGLAVGLLGRDQARLDATLDAVRTAGGRGVAVPADVTSPEQVAAAVAAVEDDLGGVDLLVNNAGRIESSEVPVWEADPQEWWSVVETNLRGPFLLVRAVVPGMLECGGGRVVDLSSGAGAGDREVYSGYCASKAGLFRVAGSVHLAGFARGLRSFEVSPGVVRTAMTGAMATHAGRTEWTPPQRTVDLVAAVAAGRLDAWSGCYLRADLDTPASLERAAVSDRPADARRLGVQPYGDGDPLG